MAIRKIIEIDKEKCNACGECIPSCAEHALYIENNELKIREDRLCDGLGACLGNCPKDALKIIEREAEDFSHEAVEEFIKSNKSTSCSSLNLENPANKGFNWPVKLALISPEVDFIKNKKLVIVADCAAISANNIKDDYIKDSIPLLACPKLENKEMLVEKFATIFKSAHTKEISIVRMEVPCCMLPELINKSIQKNSIDNIHIDTHILTRDGKKYKPALQSL